jgi:hypothetical protein
MQQSARGPAGGVFLLCRPCANLRTVVLQVICCPHQTKTRLSHPQRIHELAGTSSRERERERERAPCCPHQTKYRLLHQQRIHELVSHLLENVARLGEKWDGVNDRLTHTLQSQCPRKLGKKNPSALDTKYVSQCPRKTKNCVQEQRWNCGEYFCEFEFECVRERVRV